MFDGMWFEFKERLLSAKRYVESGEKFLFFFIERKQKTSMFLNVLKQFKCDIHKIQRIFLELSKF